MFKSAYIPEPVETGSYLESSSRSQSDQVIVEAPAEEKRGAYPLVQPMKAALYFDSADGFGDWRILISTRADKALRQLRKKNTKLFKIVIKKIK